MVIPIHKELTFEEIDKLYVRFNRLKEEDVLIDLAISSELAHPHVGLIPMLYQFVITWSKYNNSGKLMVDVSADDDLNFLLENEFYFPIFSLLWNKNKIYDRTGNTSLREDLAKPMGNFRDKMEKVSPLKGWKLLLIGVDHFPISRGYLPCFENQNGFIDNESNSQTNLRLSIEQMLNYSKDAARLFTHYQADFTSIIHELVKNTIQWGRTDANNVGINPSIRGVLIKFSKLKRSSFIDQYSKQPALKSYFSHQTLRENTNKELYFLEISVFDSGLGFVDKFKSQNSSASSLTDIQIVRSCLIKNMTIAKGIYKEEKGLGLDRILNLLDQKGFLKIKTGTIHVYRNLISHPYKKVNNERDMELFDWLTNSKDQISTNLKAEGSVITILYPLN